MSNHNLKTLIQKRNKLPIFRYYGNITDSSILTLTNNFSDYEVSTDSAKNLRRTLVPDDSDYNGDATKNYHQHDIQTRIPEGEWTEKSFVDLPVIFNSLYAELTYMLNGPVCRMRYATIDASDSLPFHMDQPGIDRFICVLQGEQVVHVNAKDQTYSQVMRPGEVWYLNTNWDHSVVNTHDSQRLAMLGCYDYND
jgi:quercetin dioxygenase-like cupin family protein